MKRMNKDKVKNTQGKSGGKNVGTEDTKVWGVGKNRS